MENQETIDILLATYNGERYLEEQIASIQVQTHTKWRLLVSDDCSNDETLDIVRRLVNVDNRIVVVSEGVRHGGANSNFMQLVAKSTASYVMFCDQDDVWMPNKIELTLAQMREMEYEYGADCPLLVFTDLAIVDDSLDLLASSFERYGHRDPYRTRLANLLEQNVAPGCTMMLNRTLVELCAISKDVSRVKMHDWWTILIASACGRIRYVDEPLSLYRQHGDNVIGAQRYNALQKPGSAAVRVRDMGTRIDQAWLLQELHGGMLSEVDARCIAEYVAIGQSDSYWRGLRHLICMEGWKPGLRSKVGQILATFQTVAANRTRSPESGVVQSTKEAG